MPECLYHGSVSVFTRPDLGHGRGYKDFGCGFYMSVERTHAIGMMHKKYAEAMLLKRLAGIPEPVETLYRIRIDAGALAGMKMKRFASADEEWLDFVLSCRRTRTGAHGYDVVTGPTADDDTRLLIKNYLDGVYGEPYDGEAKRTLLRLLRPERLGVQWFIGNQSAADRLITEFKAVDWRGCE